MQDCFRHEALIYSGLEDFVVRTAAFLREGLAANESALVVVDTVKIEALKAQVGADPRVSFVDMGQAGVNPNRIIPLWREFVDMHQGRSFRGIGEPIWAGRTPDELVECQRHEMLLNSAFQHSGCWRLMCPYDESSLPPEVIDEARASHPHLSEGGGMRQSPSFRGLEETKMPLSAPLPKPVGPVTAIDFAPEQLSTLRDIVREAARSAGLSARRIEELVLAVNELATNSFRYGGGHGRLRIWRQDGSLVCEVSDGGRFLDPLVGRLKPEEGSIGGYGLWLVNQLCDLVQLRSDESGSVIRVHMRIGT